MSPMQRIQHPLAPVALSRNAWTAARMYEDLRWTLQVGVEERRDALRLAEWARTRAQPEQEYEQGAVAVPALVRLGERVRAELQRGTGIARVVGLGVTGLDDATLRLAYLATGLGTGPALGNYGRLFDVKDRGEDYKTSAVPVSMTREATSFHTDSSARDVEPDHVGLLCLQPAVQGGESLATSAVSVHEELRRVAPDVLPLLYKDYARDVVTPGTERNLDSIRANRFPIFRFDAHHGALTFRYMRYWIERAHGLIGEPLTAAETNALDRLDALLGDARFVLSFTLQRGEMLWVNNRSIAHNRTAFTDDPRAPRTLVRMWTLDPGRPPLTQQGHLI